MPRSAYFIIAAHALFPNLTARVMKIVNRSMPPRVGKSGDEARSGAEVRGKK
jgi:hypothetical protein